jgi:hypothetical protein
MYIVVFILLLVFFGILYSNWREELDTVSGSLGGTTLGSLVGGLSSLTLMGGTTPDTTTTTPDTTTTTPDTTTTPPDTTTTPDTTTPPPILVIDSTTPIETIVSSTSVVITTDPVTGIKTTVTTVTDPVTGKTRITTQTEDTVNGVITVTDPDTGAITTTKTTVDSVTGLSTVTVSVKEANPIDVLNSKRSNVYNSLKQRHPFIFPNACYKFSENYDYTKLNPNVSNIRNYHPSIGFMTQNLLHDNCNAPKTERFNGGSHESLLINRKRIYIPVELNVGNKPRSFGGIL